MSPPHFRTPDHRFADLPGHPWAGRYVADLPSLGGLRVHRLTRGRETHPSRGCACMATRRGATCTGR